uniref:Putative secreted protein n=1 Tax=Ixodes scapularis TaxID=6945 RepID=Q4PMY4_IXOSC|nr:putative secreted protein [Ixodes scapularis]
MKATLAVLCFLVAVACAIVVEEKMVSHPIDEEALDPRCVKPVDCPGNEKEVSFYDPRRGCQLIRLGENCTHNDNYPTLDLCNEHCPPAPGTHPRRA